MKRKRNVFYCPAGKCDQADRATAMLKMGAEQKFDEREGEGMKEKEQLREAIRLFLKLSPEERDEIMEMIAQLGKKKADS